jgi:uncharacterized membrane protein
VATSQTAPVPRFGFFRVLWRATRQVFHETIGAVFFVLAFSWTAATVRLWRHASPPWLCAIAAVFALIMVTFGLTSFRAARRVR